MNSTFERIMERNWLLCIYCLVVMVLAFFEPGVGAAGWFLLAMIALERKPR